MDIIQIVHNNLMLSCQVIFWLNVLTGFKKVCWE